MTRLVPLAESHLDAVAAMLDDPEIVRYTLIPEPVPEDFARTWYARYEEGRRSGTREAFAILDGDFVGLALVPTLDRDTATAELGYIVAAHARGRGVASSSLRQLTAWAFEQGMERLELRISVGNEPSKRVAAAAGYTLEGVQRSAYFKQGRREDTEVWSRLPGDG